MLYKGVATCYLNLLLFNFINLTLGPELCQLVRVWLITEVFVMYSTE